MEKQLRWSDVFREGPYASYVDLKRLGYVPNPDMPEWVGWVESAKGPLHQTGPQIRVFAHHNEQTWIVNVPLSFDPPTVRGAVVDLLRALRRADQIAANKRAAERMAARTDCCEGEPK